MRAGHTFQPWWPPSSQGHLGFSSFNYAALLHLAWWPMFLLLGAVVGHCGGSGTTAAAMVNREFMLFATCSLALGFYVVQGVVVSY